MYATFKNVDKPRVELLTLALVTWFFSIPTHLGDRTFRKLRAKRLKKAIDDRWFRNPEWAIGVIGGKKYRLNGQHTMHVLLEAFNSGWVPETPIYVVIHEYEVESERALVKLYNTFDSKMSSRSVADNLCMDQVMIPALAKIKPAVSVAVAKALLFFKSNGIVVKSGIMPWERSDALLENQEFVNWVADIYDPTSSVIAFKYAVIAAMCAVWEENHDNPEELAKASDFWIALRDGTNLDKTDPAYVLRENLLKCKAPGKGNKVCMYIPEKRQFEWVITAWHARVDNKTIVIKRHVAKIA